MTTKTSPMNMTDQGPAKHFSSQHSSRGFRGRLVQLGLSRHFYGFSV